MNEMLKEGKKRPARSRGAVESGHRQYCRGFGTARGNRHTVQKDRSRYNQGGPRAVQVERYTQDHQFRREIARARGSLEMAEASQLIRVEGFTNEMIRVRVVKSITSAVLWR